MLPLKTLTYHQGKDKCKRKRRRGSALGGANKGGQADDKRGVRGRHAARAPETGNIPTALSVPVGEDLGNLRGKEAQERGPKRPAVHAWGGAINLNLPPLAPIAKDAAKAFLGQCHTDGPTRFRSR